MNRKNHCTRAISNSILSRYLIAALIPVSLFLFASCSGKAIGDAQNFDPNDAPTIESISVTNPDGSAVESSKIEPFTSFAVTVTAADPDNDALSYSFTSNCGSFSQMTPTAAGCTVVFKTGNISGGQKLKLSAKASDSKGGSSSISYDMGTGKIGPTVTALLGRTRITPEGMMTLSVRANCSGLFQIVPDGTLSSTIDYTKDMMNYSYSENGTTSCVIMGPTCTLTAGNIKLPAKMPYTNNTNYDIAIVFRDGLFQGDTMVEKLYVDGEKPKFDNTDPEQGGNIPSLSSDIHITFSEPMDPSSFSSSSLSINLAGGTDSAKTVKFIKYNEDMKKATYSIEGISKCSMYSAVLNGVRDLAGNIIDEGEDLNSITLYSPAATISFNGNGSTSGHVPNDVTRDYTDYSTLPLPGKSDCTICKKVNSIYYGFKGWATSPNAPINQIITTFASPLPSDITLYPVWGDLAIGDRGPAGGWIFIANGTTNNSGDSDGGWKYMEVAPYVKNKTEAINNWGYNGSFVGGTSSAVGSGYNNTTLIYNKIMFSSISTDTMELGLDNLPHDVRKLRAACYCYLFSYNGYDDWYAPSVGELNDIFIQYSNGKLGVFASDVTPRYYSSTEVDANKTWYYLFADSTDVNYLPASGYTKGTKYSSHKSDSAMIRPVRRFK